jgi:hypothetical protein
MGWRTERLPAVVGAWIDRYACSSTETPTGSLVLIVLDGPFCTIE